MRDVKKSLKNKDVDVKENKNDTEMFMENPFILAIMIFAAAFLINYLFELEFTKNLFNWCEYYFNLTLYNLNSFIQPTFKNHPFIKIPVLTNPVSAEFMGFVNPWMWLRGFIISSFIVGQVVTILQIKTIKSKNIVIAVILTSLLQLGLYVYPYSTALSFPVFMSVLEKVYINLFALMFVCLVSVLSGGEYAVYLLRNDKIQVAESKTNGPNIEVKTTTKLDW